MGLIDVDTTGWRPHTCCMCSMLGDFYTLPPGGCCGSVEAKFRCDVPKVCFLQVRYQQCTCSSTAQPHNRNETAHREELKQTSLFLKHISDKYDFHLLYLASASTRDIHLCILAPTTVLALYMRIGSCNMYVRYARIDGYLLRA